MLSIDEAAVTRAVKKLADGGFVMRKEDTGDMRSFSLFLTERGHKAIPLLLESFEDWDKRCSGIFGRKSFPVCAGNSQKW